MKRRKKASKAKRDIKNIQSEAAGEELNMQSKDQDLSTTRVTEVPSATSF